MTAWSERLAELTHEQAAQLSSVGLVEVLAEAASSAWRLRSNSRIGVASGPGWELRVSPKLSVPKLFFLLAYAHDPNGWKDESAYFDVSDDLVDALASGFSWHALRAIEQGLLRDYVRLEERLIGIRGRIRFADQIARSGGLPFPVEVAYDDYIEDIIENRIIKAASLALLRMPRIAARARQRLLKLKAILDEVTPLSRPREVEVPRLTRLNQRYGPALRLGVLILRAASIDTPRGRLAATAFVFDMNKVFEDFVSIALRESIARFGGELNFQWRGRLDQAGAIRIIPDLTWWVGGTCRAVADVKYKALDLTSMPNADAYQMLAYCTALSLERGFLIYAKDAGEKPATHHIRNTAAVIEVRALDVETEPELLLRQVDLLAEEIASSQVPSAARAKLVVVA